MASSNYFYLIIGDLFAHLHFQATNNNPWWTIIDLSKYSKYK